MMKKLRKGAMESLPPSSSSFPIRDEARMMFKHQSLLQDYNELTKETDAKKVKLQQTMQRKLKLKAEVKFLQKKYKSFMKKQYQRRAASSKMPMQTSLSAQPQTIEVINVPRMDPNQRSRDDEIPRATALFDLNKISIPKAKALEREHAPNFKEEAMYNFGQPVYQNVGSTSNQVGRRRMPWQDQEVLGL